MSPANNYNPNHKAVARILRELRELEAENSEDVIARLLEDHIFEWHFAIRGPPGTDFEGGIYHGRIKMPSNYPNMPPDFILLTPSGRFKTGEKICLSNTAYHTDNWQCSWTVRTMLLALIHHMPTPGEGAIGALDFPGPERRALAAKSRAGPPAFRDAARQQVASEIHAAMLAREESSQSRVRGRKLGSASTSEPETPAQKPRMAHATASSSSRDAQVEQLPSDSSHTGAGHERDPGVTWEDRGLTLLAVAISIAIVAILGRKALLIAGIDVQDFFW